MLGPNNIFVFLMAIMPVFLYSYLVFYMIPSGLICKSRAKMYFVAGLISPSLVYLFSFLFPTWNIPILTGSILITYVMQAFIQVAFLEEGTKYLTFLWVYKNRKSSVSDLPIATVYYSLMSSAAFALYENIFYLMNFGNSILFIRGITAVVMHMICGIIMGYFLSKINESKYCTISEKTISGKFGEISNIKIKEMFKNINNVFYAILFSSLFHGIYDYNLFLPNNNYAMLNTFVILIFGLAVGNFMLREVILKSIYLRKKDNKDI